MATRGHTGHRTGGNGRTLSIADLEAVRESIMLDPPSAARCEALKNIRNRIRNAREYRSPAND